MRPLLFALGLVLFAAAAEAQTKLPAALATYDTILAAVVPGQTTVALGDMIVPVATVRLWRDQLAGTAAPGSASQMGINKWTGGNVYYAFNANVSAANRTATLDAMAEWATFANLTFTPRTAQANYIMINDGGAGLFGGNSAVGMIGGQQQLNIGSASWNRGTLAHELGHALGLIHEHQRNDRDTFVTIGTAVAGDGNFTPIPTSTNNGTYDFLSVMHYARDTFAPLGVDDITPKVGYTQFADVMGRSPDRILSRADRDGIALMYGAGPAQTTIVTNTKDSGPGSLRAAIYKALDLATDTPGVTPVIIFQIPNTDPNFSGGVFTIRPTDRLPAPGAGTTIDAGTQTIFTGDSNPSGPEVVLNGALQTGGDAYGLRLSQANVTVKGLVINGFATNAVRITGAGATGNTLAGCYVGTNAAGTAAAGNALEGVVISAGAAGNRVGGTVAAARNVIAGNGSHGVILRDAGTNGNFIEGNWLGLNAAGSAALPNAQTGVAVYDGPQNNRVGGTAAGAGNVISGNTREGVIIFPGGTTGNAVLGNVIGLNPAGTAALGNGYAGVGIYDGAAGNTVGGSSAGARNVISGNSREGVVISGTGASGNVVSGNFIGLNAGGSAALGNVFRGVGIYGGAQGNVIGGTSAGARNVISGNGGQGVLITNGGTNGNFVRGSFVGTNAAGTAALPNADYGVAVWGGAQGNTVGGTAPGAGNVISGNADFGVFMTNAGTTGNFVQGNFIGTNAAGSAALANRSGVGIFGPASGNVVGGASPGARNVISGNAGAGAGDGVVVGGDGANDQQILGNTIGQNAAGTAALPNSGSGVVLFSNISGNLIGGTAPGVANLIAGNGGYGVALYGFGVVNWRNPILGNAIFDNGFEGIVTFNGANNSQAAPMLSGAVFGPAGNPAGVTVSGSLTSLPNTNFRVEFFASPTADGSGAGEGKTFLGAGVVQTNGAGLFNFTAPLGPAVPAGHTVSATATDPNGNTSAFATSIVVSSTDADSDGIPNAWTQAFWGHPTGLAADLSRAGDDADGDGETNLEELRAGTDPRSPLSRFALTIDRVGSDARLTLPTVLGRTYRLEYTSSLAPADWRLLSDQLSGDGTAFQLSDPAALMLSTRHYRATALP